MCGRTSLFAPKASLETRFDASFEATYEPRYNIAPESDLYVIHNDDPTAIVADEWGFVPAWADRVDDGPRPINAREETVAENNLFSSAFESNRALVLADGYYEWAGERGGKQPFRIVRADEQPFAMAGIWSHFEGTDHDVETVAIITTEAAEPIAEIHDRMPVVLEHGAETRWLHGYPDESEALLASQTAALESHPISTLVNDPTNDSPAVIDPVGGDSGQAALADFDGD